jgi:uncharacterized protein (DUF1810 family)
MQHRKGHRKNFTFKDASRRAKQEVNTMDQEHADFDLERFVDAQAPDYESAFNELRIGRKRSHWMWYIFPQVAGLGGSAMSRRFAIGSRAEAAAYLRHAVLGPRLLECTAAMLDHPDLSAHAILGSPDDLKFRSSMTLFAEVSEKGSPFERALQQFYDGKHDEKTIALLGL